MPITPPEVVAAIVESLIAAVIYDKVKPIGAGFHTEKQEKILHKALTKYLQSEEQRFGADGAAILTEVQGRIPSAQVYRNALKAFCNREQLLKLWMEGYSGEFPQEVGTLCGGCIDIILNNIKRWPEFLPDVAVKTLQKTDTLEQNQSQMLDNQSEMLANQGKIMEYMKRPASEKKESAHTPQSLPPEVKNQNDAYLRKWTDNLFLNNPRKNPNAKPAAAQELHIPLSFRFGEEKEPQEDEDNPLWSWLSESGGHLVLGDPGIGKSTVIARYLAEQGGKTSILAYPLTEFKLNWEEERHPGATLLQKIGHTADSLKNTVLFLDGLDECAITPENRAGLLRRLEADWGSEFPWVVTCRLNYIPEDALKSPEIGLPIYTLCPLTSVQIGHFIDKYEAKTGEQIADSTRETLTAEEQNGVFGIPLILYLIVASKLEISPGHTLVTVYDKLFGEDSHFYHRSYDLRRDSLSKEYIRKVRQMSRDIALYMLLHESEKATIPENEYREIEKACGAAEEGEPLLDAFLHRGIVEGTAELCFVHRTMYEYFVAEGFVSLAVAAETPEELSGVIGWYWHKEQMGTTIEQYVKEKLEQKKAALDFSRWEDAGLLLMEKGVRRCCEGRRDPISQCLKYEQSDSLVEDRQRENTAFWHLCFLLSWVREITETSSLVFQRFEEAPEVLISAMRHCGADCDHIFCPDFFLYGAYLAGAYLGATYWPGANLAGAILTGAVLTGAISYNADLTDSDLCRANLTDAHLSDANLCNADLTRADLCRANLTGAHLCDADLYNADLTDVDLCRANLTGAHLCDANLRRANMSFADLRRADMTCANLRKADMTAVFLSDANMTGADMTAVFLSDTNMTGAELCGVNLTDAYLCDAKLTEKQVNSLGFQLLSSCIFDRIHVFNDAEGFAIYTRSDFFAHFFPDK